MAEVVRYANKAGGFRTNLPVLRGKLIRKAAETNAQTMAVTKHYGELLLRRTREHASGRPGPNVITGEYRASFRVTYANRLAYYQATVTTDAPQAMRLEFGFVGTDAIGRTYDQPPFPHMRPAFRETQPEYIAAMAAVGGRAVT